MREPEYLRKLFIGGLDFRTTDDTLKSFYEQWGEIVDVVVMKDPNTKRSRGFGFVTYSSSSMVDDAQAHRPHTINNRVVEPKRAIPRNISEANNAEVNATVKKLFIAGIKDDVTEDDLKAYFSEFGNVINTTLVTEKGTGKKRGFGFVEFDDYDPVDKAILQQTHTLNGKRIDVKKAVGKQEMAQKKMGGGGGGGRGGGGRGAGGPSWEDDAVGGYGGGYGRGDAGFGGGSSYGRDGGYGGGGYGGGNGYGRGGGAGGWDAPWSGNVDPWSGGGGRAGGGFGGGYDDDIGGGPMRGPGMDVRSTPYRGPGGGPRGGRGGGRGRF